jgi:hypothetical protein
MILLRESYDVTLLQISISLSKSREYSAEWAAVKKLISPTKSVRTNLVIIIEKTLAPKPPLAKTSKAQVV